MRFRLSLMLMVAVGSPMGGSAAAARPVIVDSIRAANTFLSTLSTAQRAAVLYPFDDEAQRRRWTMLPVPVAPRGGLSLRDLSLPQQQAAMGVLAAVLSPQGFAKVQQIMLGDEIVRTDPTIHPRPPPPGALDPESAFGQDLYYIAILGVPSAVDPWMLQFTGHHLALNITVVAERGILTPSITGAQPASYESAGQRVRPLGAESDKALQLLHSFDAAQLAQAVLGSRVADLVLGPGQDGVVIAPEGLKAAQMSATQRAMLLGLMDEWASIIHEDAAAVRRAQLEADIEETWFLWSGPTSGTVGENIAAYYRIQGPHVVIEYAPQLGGGGPTQHVHTVYRDPAHDYGRGPGPR